MVLRTATKQGNKMRNTYGQRGWSEEEDLENKKGRNQQGEYVTKSSVNSHAFLRHNP